MEKKWNDEIGEFRKPPTNNIIYYTITRGKKTCNLRWVISTYIQGKTPRLFSALNSNWKIILAQSVSHSFTFLYFFVSGKVVFLHLHYTRNGFLPLALVGRNNGKLTRLLLYTDVVLLSHRLFRDELHAIINFLFTNCRYA